MPLLDHFHPPIEARLRWESLHSAWATHLADRLNEHWLSSEFLAVERGRLGSRIEIDVATFERPCGTPPSTNGGAVATLPRTWAPPAQICTVPTAFLDDFEVQVYAGGGGWNLVAAIELISPGNKDRAEEREAFTSKCSSYLHQGVSVVLIDVVTNRRANLHHEVLHRLQVTNERAFLPDGVHLYAAAYRPVLRDDRSEIDVWRQACVIGEALPDMPLRLTGDLFVPVEFEAAYMETCRRRRVL